VKRFFIKILIIIIIIISLKLPSVEASEPGKVILLVSDYLKLNDFYISTELNKLASQSRVGLLNPNTGASCTIPHTYTTVNAGRMVSAPRSGIQVYNGQEKIDNVEAHEIFISKTGHKTPPNAVVVLSFPQLLEHNKANNTEHFIGHLGSILNSAGLTTAVLGNSDTPDLKDRAVAIIGMNSLGYINFGDVSNSLNTKTNDFMGLRTDYVKLFESFKDVYKQADFIIVNLGDLVRLERKQAEALPHLILRERQEILTNIANFITQVIQITDFENDLILAGSLSQNPQNALGENRMLPFLIIDKKINKGSILTSGTTKRPGIIANVDIAATILEHFNLSYTATIGRPFQVISKSTNPIEYLNALNQRISFIYDARNPLVKTYVLLQITTVLSAIPVIFLFPKMISFMKILLLTLTSYPLSLLLLGTVITNSIFFYTIISLLITGSLVFVSAKMTNNWLISFLFIEALTVLTILGDLATGANLAKFSPLSYQVITGARYYGIGNEYMGVLIGALIISSSIIYHLFPHNLTRIIITGLLFISTLFIALPQLGINFGGTITAVIAFCFILLSWQGVKPSVNMAIGMSVISIICLSLVVSFDLTQNIKVQSHLGRTALLIKEQGLAELWLIMSRKFAMNIKLFRYTNWSRVFIASLLASTFLLFKPVSIFNTLKVNYPKLFLGFLGTIVGSIVALIFNDSGIVASATMMIYSALPLIYLAFEERLIRINISKETK
jgi:hypothetical protein